jgi:hypothetical protein
MSTALQRANNAGHFDGLRENTASKSHTLIQNPKPGNFEPESIGSCPFPYQEYCRGIRVLVLNAGQDGSARFAKMVNVTATELYVIFPDIDVKGNKTIVIQKDYDPSPFFNWVATHLQAYNLRRNSPTPFVNNPGLDNYYVGTLYGVESGCSGVTALQVIAASGNPKSYSGFPTFLQTYWTGVHSQDWDDNSWTIFGSTGFGSQYVKPFDAVYSDGVYIMNIFRDGGGACGAQPWGFAPQNTYFIAIFDPAFEFSGGSSITMAP